MHFSCFQDICHRWGIYTSSLGIRSDIGCLPVYSGLWYLLTGMTCSMSPEPTISWCARPSLSVSCMNFWITEDGHCLSEVTQLLPGGELIVFWHATEMYMSGNVLPIPFFLNYQEYFCDLPGVLHALIHYFETCNDSKHWPLYNKLELDPEPVFGELKSRCGFMFLHKAAVVWLVASIIISLWMVYFELQCAKQLYYDDSRIGGFVLILM